MWRHWATSIPRTKIAESIKTTDGGKTWTKSLGIKVGDRAIGVCDIVMDPKNPKVLYAATYDKDRKPWMFRLGGPGSGIYKTVDAGATWTKLTAGSARRHDRPHRPRRRPSNPDVVYANIENANKPGMSDADREKELLRGQVERGDDRPGGIPKRRRRKDLEEGQPGKAARSAAIPATTTPRSAWTRTT